MAKINLRDFYPWYTNDEFIEIPDEAAAAISEDVRRENAYKRKVRRHKAYYTLGLENEIEIGADDKNKPPLNTLIENHDKQLLYSAIAKLPNKQAKRLYAYFFLDMSTIEIANAEGVAQQSVSDSLKGAARNLKKFLKKANQGDEEQIQNKNIKI